jgi:hypothetical protein
VTELPTTVAAEVQRILDGTARRLLAAKTNGEPVTALAGRDNAVVDEGADKGAAFVEGEDVEVLRPVEGDGRDGGGP